MIVVRACNKCVEVCPVDRPNAFNFDMDMTKAIYLPHAMAFPEEICRSTIPPANSTECGKCVGCVCPYGRHRPDDAANGLSAIEGRVPIIMATGWKPYDAAKIDNLGFGTVRRCNHERDDGAAGSSERTDGRGRSFGRLMGSPPTLSVFVQCAGQRDTNYLGYCSGICCLGSLKQATYVREAECRTPRSLSSTSI